MLEACSINYSLARIELETTLMALKTRGTYPTHNKKQTNKQKNAGNDNAFCLLKSPPLRTRKTKTENRHQSFVELVVCDLQVLNYGLSPSLPLQAF